MQVYAVASEGAVSAGSALLELKQRLEVVKETLYDAFPTVVSAYEFAAVRARLLQMGGALALRSELEGLGFVKDGQLTTGTKPFNVFARVASGAMLQPGMEAETAALGEASARYMIACNRPENDEH